MPVVISSGIPKFWKRLLFSDSLLLFASFHCFIGRRQHSLHLGIIYIYQNTITATIPANRIDKTVLSNQITIICHVFIFMLVAKTQGMEPPKNKIADTDTTATTYLDAAGSDATTTLGTNISPNTIAQALDTIRCSGRPISESRYVNGAKIRPKISKTEVFCTRIEAMRAIDAIHGDRVKHITIPPFKFPQRLL